MFFLKRAVLLSAIMAISFSLTASANDEWNSTCDRKEFKELYKSILRSDLQSTAVFSDFLPPAPFKVYENEVVNKDNTIVISSLKLGTTVKKVVENFTSIKVRLVKFYLELIQEILKTATEK